MQAANAPQFALRSVRLFSTCTTRAAGLGIPHGTDHPSRIPPEPGARDDAAADAGHQAAAALESRSHGLCRGGTREKPAARARQRRRRADCGGRRPPNGAGGGPDGEGAQEWIGEDLATSRNAIEDDLGTRLDNVFPEDGAVRDQLRRGPRMRPRRIPNGRASDRAAARTANTISKPSCRPSGRSRIISSEQLSLSVTDPVRRMIGQHLIDLVDEAGYLSGDLAGGGREARRRHGRGRGRARGPAGLRSRGRLRAQPDRMPRDPAQGAQPLRSRHGGAAGASRSAGET